MRWGKPSSSGACQLLMHPVLGCLSLARVWPESGLSEVHFSTLALWQCFMVCDACNLNVNQRSKVPSDSVLLRWWSHSGSLHFPCSAALKLLSFSVQQPVRTKLIWHKHTHTHTHVHTPHTDTQTHPHTHTYTRTHTHTHHTVLHLPLAMAMCSVCAVMHVCVCVVCLWCPVCV